MGVFLFAMILANIGGNMYQPLLPLYLKDLGAGVTQIGLFFTLSQVIPLALQILGGWISDTIGRLRAIAFGSLAGVLAYMVLILSPSWEWLLLGSAFSSIGGALVAPSFEAFIAENSQASSRARVFGISQALFMVVGVIGPVLGGLLADTRGFQFMLIVAAVFYFIATIIRFAMARSAAKNVESQPRKLSLTGLRFNLVAMMGLVLAGGVVSWIMITDGVRDISFGLSLNFLPVYMQQIGGMNLKQIGLLNSVFGLFMMLTTIPAGWLADKKGERVVISSGFIFLSLAMLVFVFMPVQSIWFYALGWACGGIGIGLATPGYSSLISKVVPRELRGTAFGLFSTSLGLVSLPAPWLGGILWTRFSPQTPFLVTGILSMLCAIPAWIKFRSPKSDTKDNPG
jgi:MFS family permease